MLGFIIILILLLIGAGVWCIQIKANSDGNKFIHLFPCWVFAYGVSMAMLCPVAFFRIWEHNIDAILTSTVFGVALIFALLIIATLIVTIMKKQYRNAGRIVGIGVLLIIYTFIVSLFAGMGEGAFDNFGKRHPIPEGMEYEETIVEKGWYSRYRTRQEWDSVITERKFLLTGEHGVYRYMVYLPPMDEEGDIYLKMYEATTNLPLSEKVVKNRSNIHILPSDTAVIYQMKGISTSSWLEDMREAIVINEGSWEDYYAARTELWFRPTNGGEERLVYSKIFRIDGYSR